MKYLLITLAFLTLPAEAQDRYRYNRHGPQYERGYDGRMTPRAFRPRRDRSTQHRFRARNKICVDLPRTGTVVCN